MGSYRLQMTRGFQIWLQNLNRTTFGPFSGKKNSRERGNQFSNVFWPNRGSTIVQFKFLGHIWYPLVICNLYDSFFLKILIFLFLGPHCNLNFSNGPCGPSFFFQIRNFRCHIRNQRPKRHKNGCCSHRIAEQNSGHNPTYHFIIHCIWSLVFSPLISPELIKILMFASKSFYF